MTQLWQPGTQYNIGDVVEYSGHAYKIIQPHRSQSDWTPDVTPALWGRMQEGWQQQQPQQQQPASHGGGYQPGYGQQQEPVRPPPPVEQHSGANWDEHKHQKVDIPPEEQKKSWHDIDEKRKKELEIGGGLVAGLAALGAGIYAYKKHEDHEEDKKANVWALQNWLTEAQGRTEDFYRNGPRGPITWLLVHGKNFPQNMISGGEEHGQPIYIARAFHNGSLQVGKAGSMLAKGCSFGYGHDEISVDTFEVLVGDLRAVRWVDAHGKLNLQELGVRPVEAGREGNGQPLYIAQAHINNSVHPGKCSEKLSAAFIPYGGTEKEAKTYRVLCYV